MILLLNKSELVGIYDNLQQGVNDLSRDQGVDLTQLSFVQAQAVPADVISGILQQRRLEAAYNSQPGGKIHYDPRDRIAQKKLQVAMRQQQQAGKLDKDLDITLVPGYFAKRQAEANGGQQVISQPAEPVAETPAQPSNLNQRERARQRQGKPDGPEVVVEEVNGSEPAANVPQVEQSDIDAIIDVVANASSAQDVDAAAVLASKKHKRDALLAALQLDASTKGTKIELATQVMRKFYTNSETDISL